MDEKQTILDRGIAELLVTVWTEYFPTICLSVGRVSVSLRFRASLLQTKALLPDNPVSIDGQFTFSQQICLLNKVLGRFSSNRFLCSNWSLLPFEWVSLAFNTFGKTWFPFGNQTRLAGTSKWSIIAGKIIELSEWYSSKPWISMI